MRADVHRVISPDAANHDPSRTTKDHSNTHFTMDDGIVRLSGPKYGYIAEGELRNITSSYEGSPYDFHLDVLVRVGSWLSNNFRRERWFVTILEPAAMRKWTDDFNAALAKELA